VASPGLVVAGRRGAGPRSESAAVDRREGTHRRNLGQEQHATHDQTLAHFLEGATVANGAIVVRLWRSHLRALTSSSEVMPSLIA
jgi:hypothetical protein